MPTSGLDDGERVFTAELLDGILAKMLRLRPSVGTESGRSAAW